MAHVVYALAFGHASAFDFAFALDLALASFDAKIGASLLAGCASAAPSNEELKAGKTGVIAESALAKLSAPLKPLRSQPLQSLAPKDHKGIAHSVDCSVLREIRAVTET